MRGLMDSRLRANDSFGTHPADLPDGCGCKNPVKPSFVKYSAFPKRKSAVWSLRSAPTRGVRVVTNVERNAVDVDVP
jgi:hypothetical protein